MAGVWVERFLTRHCRVREERGDLVPLASQAASGGCLEDLLTGGRPRWPWGPPAPASSLSRICLSLSPSAGLQACWGFELGSSSLQRTVLQGQALLEKPSSQWGVR